MAFSLLAGAVRVGTAANKPTVPDAPSDMCQLYFESDTGILNIGVGGDFVPPSPEAAAFESVVRKAGRSATWTSSKRPFPESSLSATPNSRCAEGDANSTEPADAKWTITSGMPVLSAHVVLAEEADPPAVLEELCRCLSGDFDIEHSTFQLETADRRRLEEAAHT